MDILNAVIDKVNSDGRPQSFDQKRKMYIDLIATIFSADGAKGETFDSFVKMENLDGKFRGQGEK